MEAQALQWKQLARKEFPDGSVLELIEYSCWSIRFFVTDGTLSLKEDFTNRGEANLRFDRLVELIS